MLTIKNLTASKELDREAMADIAGGITEIVREMPSIALLIGSPVNAPKFAELLGTATAATGEQFNTNVQSDNDTNVVIGSGQVVNTGGNFNTTHQDAYAYAYNWVSSVQ